MLSFEIGNVLPVCGMTYCMKFPLAERQSPQFGQILQPHLCHCVNQDFPTLFSFIGPSKNPEIDATNLDLSLPS